MSARDGAVSAGLIVIAAATLYVYWTRTHPSQRDVANALFEYYGALRARVASGDKTALAEVATRIQNGPWPNIAYTIAYEVVPAMETATAYPRNDREYRIAAQWLRSHLEQLEYDPATGTFTLREDADRRALVPAGESPPHAGEECNIGDP